MQSENVETICMFSLQKSNSTCNGCTFIVHKLYKCFCIKVENPKPSPYLAYEWVYGMSMHYTI